MSGERIQELQGGELAEQTLGKPSAFLRAVTDFGEKHEVLAKEDIYARNGIKLLNRGSRLRGRSYEHLVAHKLLKPIEQTIEIADAPDARQIISMAHAEASRIPSLRPLLGQAMLNRLFERLEGAYIPEPLMTQLAVMKSERPRLFQHSLLAAVISMALGIRADLPQDELHALALGSLFHDIGELYIHPDLVKEGHKLEAAERRHIYAHPVTGFLLLKEFSELPKGTADAVLQHHERLDGAGYPSHLPGEQISRVARFLAVAEVTASLIEKDGADKRIGMKFRMNMKKYDAQAVAVVCGLFADTPIEGMPVFDEQELAFRLGQLGVLFKEWDHLAAHCSGSQKQSMQPVADRINGLRMMVLEPGYDQYELGRILDATGEADPDICTELLVLLDELTWHFGAFCRAMERDHLTSGMSTSESLRNRFDSWISLVKAFIGEANLHKIA